MFFYEVNVVYNFRIFMIKEKQFLFFAIAVGIAGIIIGGIIFTSMIMDFFYP